MAQGPPPRALTDEALSKLLSEHTFGTLATNKRSGHPHLTTMVYAWHPEDRVLTFSTTAERIKVRQLRNDPRAALHVSSADHWSFAVAEGEATVSEPPPEPDENGERRVEIRLKVTRLYGTILDFDSPPAPA